MEKSNCVTVATFLIVFYLICISNSQIFDPYGLTTGYISIIKYHHGELCLCPSSYCTLNNSTFNVEQLSINQEYTLDQSTVLFKLNLSTCDSVNVFTDHTNYISYSSDMINWNPRSFGQAYLCPQMGELYINITSTLRSSLRFEIKQQSQCGSPFPNVSNSIQGGSGLFKGFSRSVTAQTNNFTILISSDNCELNNSIGISVGNISYLYRIDSSFTFYNPILNNYTITIRSDPINSTGCNYIIYIYIYTSLKMYTRRVLTYNNTQIDKYLVLGTQYIPGKKITVNASGEMFTEFSEYQITNLDDDYVYRNWNTLGISRDYIDPLLKLYGEYSDSNVFIGEDFNFTSDLILNNSIMNITLSEIPVILTIENSLLILPAGNLSLPSLNVIGNNAFIWNNGTLIISSAQVSGSLNISGNFGVEAVIMRYSNLTGRFDNINVVNSTCTECGHVGSCSNHTVKYEDSRLLIIFDPPDGCSEEDYLMTIVLISCAVGLVIILIVGTIIALKVQYFRQRLFPHRDRASLTVESGNKDKIEAKDYQERRGRVYKSYRIPN